MLAAPALSTATASASLSRAFGAPSDARASAPQLLPTDCARRARAAAATAGGSAGACACIQRGSRG
eukprot:4090540-Pleurochrysis_carterae.AAC.2